MALCPNGCPHFFRPYQHGSDAFSRANKARRQSAFRFFLLTAIFSPLPTEYFLRDVCDDAQPKPRIKSEFLSLEMDRISLKPRSNHESDIYGKYGWGALDAASRGSDVPHIAGPIPAWPFAIPRGSFLDLDRFHSACHPPIAYDGAAERTGLCPLFHLRRHCLEAVADGTAPYSGMALAYWVRGDVAGVFLCDAP